jgi:hypothetical protein
VESGYQGLYAEARLGCCYSIGQHLPNLFSTCLLKRNSGTTFTEIYNFENSFWIFKSFLCV